jgi:hypothetical protein
MQDDLGNFALPHIFPCGGPADGRVHELFSFLIGYGDASRPLLGGKPDASRSDGLVAVIIITGDTGHCLTHIKAVICSDS